ncbi:YbaB/EbfC family DNA-binding protein [Mycobacterium timonense]|uniref:YbaB/EbfC family DNA-binding protein n=4 Tax=Mycobacteriaceae TaxID=1762 RepID=A0AAW5S463_MYCBC|nr:hypothetical protein ACT16_20430 [Mycobacterium heckeshornense]MCV6989750.1 YbaB/EbfC family DNA-binding protein [Mycobacterium bouchedurhonense]MCV6996690.1 YbaB/EbfC family DNA-binding protein [Mycobacterium timonense]ORW05019.1 hypothetical protein AWC14_02055 [Mycobacterium kyorinense]ORA43637.1 hypothetical protein BST19_22750 [Mycobacterium bouchedurhonense]
MFYRREFTVFNPAGSVGVSCNGRGQVSGLFLDEDALTSDDELAKEIVTIAGLARAKYRMELRLFSLQCVEAQGRNPDRMDRFYRGVQKLPTPEEYREMEAATFADRYPQ